MQIKENFIEPYKIIVFVILTIIGIYFLFSSFEDIF